MPATVIGGAALVGDGEGGCFVAGPPRRRGGSGGMRVGRHAARLSPRSRPHPQRHPRPRRGGHAAATSSPPLRASAAACSSTRGVRRPWRWVASSRRARYGASPEAKARPTSGTVGAVARHGHAARRRPHDRPRRAATRAAQPRECRRRRPARARAGHRARDGGAAGRALSGRGAALPGGGHLTGDIRVVDDFAHNGDKIRAALTTAQAGAPRIVAVFQPHGFGPARFLRPELKALLPSLLRPRRPLLLRGDLLRGRHPPRTSPAATSPTIFRPPSTAATRATTPPSSMGHGEGAPRRHRAHDGRARSRAAAPGARGVRRPPDPPHRLACPPPDPPPVDSRSRVWMKRSALPLVRGVYGRVRRCRDPRGPAEVAEDVETSSRIHCPSGSGAPGCPAACTTPGRARGRPSR